MQLIDTNLLIYAFDADSGAKHATACKLMHEIFSGELPAAISNQTLAEFYSVATRANRPPLSKEQALNCILDLINCSRLTKLDYDCSTIPRAATLSKNTGAHFWDALLAQTALDNGIRFIITEDDHFRKIPGLKVVNPFK
ncbi:TPA: PIN domain-containing protein [Candidatus Micrarchaeota archaeon]|nr:MAG: hypothetical protein AUJ65_04045 [Candidatus Micrarchaeota archaeon CG1_02_51_15]HII39574.1 PIN domain-containing protein [Candidatus Micrarchaeota archaeon]